MWVTGHCNLAAVSRNRYGVEKTVDTHKILINAKHKLLLHLSIFYEYQQFFQHRICFSIQPQLQLVNLHRNRRYFVIQLQTWFCLSYFLKKNITFYCIYLRVEVAAVSRIRYGVEKTVDTHKILINAIKVYVCLQEI
jgi:hypothetical protein